MGTTTVPFTVPSFAEGIAEALAKVMDSGWVTTGPQTAAFEQDFADHLGADPEVTSGAERPPDGGSRGVAPPEVTSGAKRPPDGGSRGVAPPEVIGVASCTAAIELCLRAMDLPPGSAVLTPSLTFCGAVNAIAHAGHRPVLVDIDADTLVPGPDEVARAAARVGPAAMITQNQGGYPVDVAALAEAAGLDRTKVVEDAAHGPGAARDGVRVGARSYAACFSFYATKNMPIGEGGAVATDDQELADRVRAMRLHGMSKDSWRRYLPGGSWRYDVQRMGLKANMTDIQAAIGRAQLAELPGWQRRRAEIVAAYDAALRDLPGLVLPQRDLAGIEHAWHLYQVLVPDRDAIIAELEAAGVATSVHFIPVSHMTAYRELLGPDECAAVPVTDRVADELLSLPLYPALTEDGLDRTVAAVTTALRARGPRD